MSASTPEAPEPGKRLGPGVKPIVHAKMVSKHSAWDDDVWQFDNETPGQHEKTARITWDFKLPGGSVLTDPAWAEFLFGWKLFVDSLRTDPHGGTPLGPGSMSSVQRGLSLLVPWMVGRGYLNFEAFDNEASWEFLNELLRKEVDTTDVFVHGKPPKLSFSPLWVPIRLVALLYRQRKVFRDAGLPAPQEPYFDGMSANAVLKELGKRKDGRIPPLPDDRSLAIMERALYFLDHPAEDAIRIVEEMAVARENGLVPRVRRRGKEEPGKSSFARAIAVHRVAAAFEFSIDPATGEPWHCRLERGSTTGARGDKEVTLKLVEVARGIVHDVMGAAVTVLQSHTGIRASEIAAMVAGTDPETGLPVCIKTKLSLSGLTEIFYIKSTESKINKEALEWVIGARPVGSKQEPDPVKAVRVLDRLLDRWRKMSGRKELLLRLRGTRGLPNSAVSVGRALSSHVQDLLLNFTKRQVIWPGQTAETMNAAVEQSGLRSHQWRSTFALYVIRTRPNMLSAVSRHFKHLSIAMTEEGYIGNDPELLAAMDSVRTQEAAKWFMMASTGTLPFAGKMAARVEAHREELKARAAEGQDAMEAYVAQNHLHWWSADHGKCFVGLNPTASRCHAIAGTTSDSATAPNFGARSPTACLGCECFLVDTHHISFWKNRLDRLRAVLSAADKSKGDEYRVAKAREQQAEAILRAFKKRGLDD